MAAPPDKKSATIFVKLHLIGFNRTAPMLPGQSLNRLCAHDITAHNSIADTLLSSQIFMTLRTGFRNTNQIIRHICQHSFMRAEHIGIFKARGPYFFGSHIAGLLFCMAVAIDCE